ncbi:MAG: GAF domain-containing protein [Candidatus Omnitrophica bacterium]|nr:GAF domain-containing protein [Candidatus Omnitrophota bacterium]
MFKKIKIQKFDNSSVVVKFHVLFVVMAIVPMGLLMYLYWELTNHGTIGITIDELNTVLLLAIIGIAVGYVAMRLLLKNLVDVARMSANKLCDVVGPEKVQAFLKGDENEIAVLTRTFNEITTRVEELEQNVNSLEVTKKTLQSVLTRVGQGISNIRNIDTFLDLIVETLTEALGGEKGLLLLLDKKNNMLSIKTIYGASSKAFDNRVFSLETGPFSAAVYTRNALIIPKIQSLSDEARKTADVLDFPMICAPLVLHDEVLGIIAVSGKKKGASFQEEDMTLMLSLAVQTAIAIENSKLSENADKTYFETLAALAMAVEAKDPYSRGHSDRVSQYSVAIAQQLGLAPEVVEDIKDAARIHDIGKIGVADEVLSKPGPLTRMEWAMMGRHPEIGESLVKPVATLKSLGDLIRHHHEKLDGSGYPDKLKGEQISIPVRILAVSEIYDALTTDRPYRNALVKQDALRRMREMGVLIDQDVVATLEEVLKKE